MATCHLILPHRIERQAYAPTRFVSSLFFICCCLNDALIFVAAWVRRRHLPANTVLTF